MRDTKKNSKLTKTPSLTKLEPGLNFGPILSVLGLFGPVLARILLSHFRKNSPALISDQVPHPPL